MKSYSLTRKAVLGIVLLMMSSIQLFAAFENVELAPFNYGVKTIHADAADIDNDGDLDFISIQSYFTHMHLIRNDGNALTQVYYAQMDWSVSDAKFIDYDNDGDPDLVYYTSSSKGSNVAGLRFMENDGNGNFSLATNRTTLPVASIAVGDYDNDGDDDLLLAGPRHVENLVVLSNDGNGNFTEYFN